MKPAEKRLRSYAVDLATLVDTKRDSESQRVDRVRIYRGLLILHSKQVEKKTYTIRNEDTKPRTVVVEHPVRSGWKLVDTAEPAESSANFYRFRVAVKAKESAAFAVKEENPIQTTYQLTNLTSELIAEFVRQRYINPTVEKALARIMAKKDEIAGLDARTRDRQAEVEQIFKDQQRLRDNIKALGRSEEERALVLRYTRQLQKQETRLEALHAEIASLKKQRQAAQEALEAMIANLTVDEKV
jgi:DNA repair exonuclease SbcCD ATPase subunit